jgi:N-acetylmuramoyl-L-alanine amidase
MKIENMLLTSAKARSRLPLKECKSITIHWIGPYPKHTPQGVRRWWEIGNDGTGVQASAHFIVKDSEVLQCLPLNEVAWHIGDGRNGVGNNTAIGIEVIPMNSEGEFSEESIQSVKELLKILPNVEIKRHFDWVGKDCPRFYTDVHNLVGVDNRYTNPAGGTDRWKELLERIKPDVE